MYKKGIIVASLLLLVLVFSTLSVSAQVKPNSTSTKAVSKKMVIKAKKPVKTKIQTIAVSGNEFSFLPSVIRIKKGARVNVVFTNTGKYPHNFVIDELSVKSAIIKSGKKTNVAFTANKTGSFQFYCSVPTHLDKGMKGTIVVE